MGDHTYILSERLGRGHELSDEEFEWFYRGEHENFTSERLKEVAAIVITRPWLKEVAALKTAEREGVQGYTPLSSPDEIRARQGQSGAEDASRVSMIRRRSLLTVSVAAVGVVVALFAINSLRNPLPADVSALAQLSTSHLNEADAWLGVTRDSSFGVEQVQPVGEVTTSLHPTLTWKVTNSRVQVQKISLLLGSETGGKLVKSISRPTGTVWILDEDLAPGSRYSWTVEFEVDNEVMRRSARFRTPSPEALSYLQGTSKGLDRMQEFAILVELQRYQQALPLLIQVLRDGQLTDAERVRLRELSERLREALTRQE